MPVFDPTREIPGYAEAVERESFVRDAAFLGVPETICGFDVKPLTVRHLLWLEMIESPFIVARLVDPAEAHIHVAAFMRVVSPQFAPFGRWKRRLFFWQYRRHFYRRKINAPQAVEEIGKYISESLQDAPGGAGSGGTSYWSMAASMVHALSGHYGWKVDQALDVPLKIAFQLLKIQSSEEHAKVGKRKIQFNPSDRLKSDWLAELNRKN